MTLRTVLSRGVFAAIFAAAVAAATNIAWIERSDAAGPHSVSTAGTDLSSATTAQMLVNDTGRVNLRSGHRLENADLPSSLRKLGIDPGSLKPLSLANADLNGDTFPDLIVGYASGDAGLLAVYYGRPSAFAPGPGAEADAQTAFNFTSPFAKATLLKLDSLPDFLVTGDFDRDGHVAIASATRGGEGVTIVSRSTDGELSARSFGIDGEISAMTFISPGIVDHTGVAVATNSKRGPELQWFASEQRIDGQKPVSMALPAPADTLACGRLDGDGYPDIAAVAGGKLLIAHNGGSVETVDLPFAITNATVSDFIWDRDARMEIAVAADDGSVSILSNGDLDTRPFTAKEARAARAAAFVARERGLSSTPAIPTGEWKIAEQTTSRTSAPKGGQQLLAATLVSAQNSYDLISADPSTSRLDIAVHQGSTQRSSVSFATSGAPLAVMPMRLNIHSNPGIVVLEEGSIEPTLVMFAPMAVFTVTKTADTADGACNADCSLREAVIAANASAGADQINIPAGTYQLTRVGDDNTASLGDLDINDDVTVLGAGAPATLIQGSSSATFTGNMGDKAFGINQDGTHNTLNTTLQSLQVRFTRNDIAINGAFTQTGGATDIFLTGLTGANPGPTTNLTSVTYDSNASAHSYGGALNVDSGDLSAGTNIFRGTVNISGSTFSNNKTLETVATSNQPNGGAINLYSDKHNVTISSTTITGNQTSSLNSANAAGINMRHSFGGTITLTNDTISNNIAGGLGGGILTAFNQTFVMTGGSITGNTSLNSGGGSAGGGGIWYGNNTLSGSLSGVTISNNAATAGANGVGGGLVDSSNVPLTVDNCTITGNQSDSGGGVATTSSGTTQTTTITRSVITGNTATTGGGLFVSAGIMTASLNYINSNTAATGTGVAQTGGTATVENNWWGCDGFPNAAGCQTGSGTFDANPRIDLRLSASPTSILLGGNSTLTADVIKNTDGNNTNAGNAPDVLVGRSLTFDAGTKGTINAPLTVTIPANGVQTKTFTANTNSAACGAANPSVVLDAAPQTASITVQCPELTVAKTNNVTGTAVVGQQWTWTMVVANAAGAASTTATFANGQTILTDNLPNGANINYSLTTPTIVLSAPNSGTVSCSIDANKDLNCTANGAVTIGVGGSFNVQVAATGTSPGAQANPRAAGTVMVDPNNVIVESNEANNTSSDTVTVTKANTSVNLGTSGTPTVFGENVTFTATVTVTAPGAATVTGNVTFKDNGVNIGTCAAQTVSSSQATCSITTLSVGTHPITAIYNGDSNLNASGTSNTVSQVVNKANTSVNLATSGSPSVFGQSVTFTATVNVTSPGAGTPTGNVTFKDNAVNIGTCTSQSVSSSQATCSVSVLSVGTHPITAVYNGDASFNVSGTSNTVSQVVNKADTSVSLATSGTPSVFGQSVTFTATVNVTSPGAGTPTGNVTFKDNAVNIGTCATQAVASSQATCSISTLSVSTHPITAVYNGDTNFNASGASNTVSQVVNKAETGVNLATSGSPTVFGQVVTFTATVSVTAPGAGTPTGSVAFKDNGVNIGICATRALAGNQATCSVSTLSAGPHPITAVYNGDGNFNVSAASNTVNQAVNAANTTVALQTSGSPSTTNQTVTFTATINVTSPGSGFATGSVAFKDNGVTIPSCATQAVGVNQATCQISTLTSGTHPITALYSGDTNFNTSGSNTVSQVVNPTAANVAVSGRVVTADGYGIRNARVTMTDTAGNKLTATTNAFGYFRFDSVTSGATFLASVAARGYRFDPRLVQVTDEIAGLDFVASP